MSREKVETQKTKHGVRNKDEDQGRREREEEQYRDASSGEVIIKGLVEAQRKVEMETLKKHGVREKVLIV